MSDHNPIEIHGLNMRYQRKGSLALSELDLVINEGEIFGYLGPNGAGKTTTLKILTGLLRQTSGSARIFGQNASDSAARRRIGFLPEDPSFYRYLTARETLCFFGALNSMTAHQLNDRIAEILDMVGLDYAADIRVGGFSRGMRQRLGLAQALINDPDLLLLDEPLSGLDPVGRAQIRNVIIRQASAGKTVLFSSHVLHDVEAICSRVAIISGGRLMETGTIDEMLSRSIQTIELVLTGLSDQTRETVAKLADQSRIVRERFVATTTSPEAAQKVMTLAISAGGAVESVTPHRETLEDFFVRRMQEETK